MLEAAAHRTLLRLGLEALAASREGVSRSGGWVGGGLGTGVEADAESSSGVSICTFVPAKQVK